MGDLDLGILTGDNSLKVEAVISNEQLLRVGGVVFVALFMSVLLANIITKK